MGEFWTGRALAALQALMALLLCLLPAAARAAEPGQGPFRLEERCRIAAPADADLRTIRQRLDRCEGGAPAGYYGTIWVQYDRLPAQLPDKKTWRLVLDNHPVQGVDVWLLGAGGAPDHFEYQPNASDREWAAGNYFSMLVTPTHHAGQMIVRLTNSQSHQFVRAPRVARAAIFVPIERDRAALYGISVGMLALTILFHLSLFFAMRRRFQLIYCAHVALLFTYALCYSGIVHIVAPWMSAAAISTTLLFALTAATATGTAFVVEFLGMSLKPWVRRWATLAVTASLATATMLLVAPPAWNYVLYQAANLVGTHAIIVTVGILIAACVRRQPLAGTVALGWVVPITVSLMYPARAFGLIGDADLPDGLLLLASTIECLVLSLPVTSRVRDLRIEHERAHERHVMLERQAQTDVLTGLSNRRGFNDALARAAAAHVEPMPLAVLVIDIDHFKRVNDDHGHAAGDQILRHVALHVAKVAGPGAIVSRYGGEEFVVALRGHDLMRASTIAERIRVSIGVTFEAEAELPKVTVSIGVAAGLSDEVETMLADADCALYRAKNEGRNRVMLADGPIVYSAAA